jgi:Ca2+-binding RTX toxin-like protein
MSGNEDDDHLWGDDGDDQMWGGEGFDIVEGGFGDDQLQGGADDDQLFGGLDGFTLDEDGSDVLWGDDGDDLLVGGSEDDALSGGADHDLLDGGTGNDLLLGGGGIDTFFFEYECFGEDVIEDFLKGSDTIAFGMPITNGGETWHFEVFDTNGNGVLDGGDDPVTIAGGTFIDVFGAIDPAITEPLGCPNVAYPGAILVEDVEGLDANDFDF